MKGPPFSKKTKNNNKHMLIQWFAVTREKLQQSVITAYLEGKKLSVHDKGVEKNREHVFDY